MSGLYLSVSESGETGDPKDREFISTYHMTKRQSMGGANLKFRNFNTKSYNLSHCTYSTCIIHRNHMKLLRTAAILCYFEISYNILKKSVYNSNVFSTLDIRWDPTVCDKFLCPTSRNTDGHTDPTLLNLTTSQSDGEATIKACPLFHNDCLLWNKTREYKIWHRQSPKLNLNFEPTTQEF